MGKNVFENISQKYQAVKEYGDGLPHSTKKFNRQLGATSEALANFAYCSIYALPQMLFYKNMEILTGKVARQRRLARYFYKKAARLNAKVHKKLR
jgi:hypothetical protein